MSSVLAPVTLQQVLQWLSLAGVEFRCTGSGHIILERIATLGDADATALSFLSSSKYRKQLPSCKAAAVLLREVDLALLPAECEPIVTPDPYLAYALIAQAWLTHTIESTQIARLGQRHSTAIIASNSLVVVSASIDCYAIISEAAIVGDNCHIAAHCYLGVGAKIGAGTVLHPRVTVLDGCVIGERCIVHSGAVIGADGFGFAPDARGGASAPQWVKIPQLGKVVIGDDVEIGANTTIDRGALSDTVIGSGVKIDNQVQIGHNVRIGNHSALAGCVGVAGSATIGAHCTLGGGAIVLGHLTLADNVHVSAATVVTRSIESAGNYTGIYPFDSNRAWEKSAAVVRQLSSVRDRLRDLESNKP